MKQKHDTVSRGMTEVTEFPGLTREIPYRPRQRVIGYPSDYESTRGIVDETVSFLLSMFLI
jgi:hypothetical protein